MSGFSLDRKSARPLFRAARIPFTFQEMIFMGVLNDQHAVAV